MSHANTLTQREEADAFQHTMKAKSKEYLAYDDDHELEETKVDIKYSRAMLEKVEKKTIEDFLSLVADLEHPEKDLVIET